MAVLSLNLCLNKFTNSLAKSSASSSAAFAGLDAQLAVHSNRQQRLERALPQTANARLRGGIGLGGWPWAHSATSALSTQRGFASPPGSELGAPQQAQELRRRSAHDELAGEEDLTTRSKRIVQLHSQLNQLKSKLESELKSETAGDESALINLREPVAGNAQLGRPQISLGAPCLSSSYCNQAVKNSHCNLDTFTCTCLREHVQFNATTCLPRKYFMQLRQSVSRFTHIPSAHLIQQNLLSASKNLSENSRPAWLQLPVERPVPSASARELLRRRSWQVRLSERKVCCLPQKQMLVR